MSHYCALKIGALSTTPPIIVNNLKRIVVATPLSARHTRTSQHHSEYSTPARARSPHTCADSTEKNIITQPPEGHTTTLRTKNNMFTKTPTRQQGKSAPSTVEPLLLQASTCSRRALPRCSNRLPRARRSRPTRSTRVDSVSLADDAPTASTPSGDQWSSGRGTTWDQWSSGQNMGPVELRTPHARSEGPRRIWYDFGCGGTQNGFSPMSDQLRRHSPWATPPAPRTAQRARARQPCSMSRPPTPPLTPRAPTSQSLCSTRPQSTCSPI